MQDLSRIRKITFYLLLGTITITGGIIFLPLFFSKKINKKLATSWANIVLSLLKNICNLDIEIIGKENIPKAPFIVACKHQSFFETFALYLLLPNPIFILKRELLFIPFIGMYLKNVCAIVIDRSKGRRAILHIKQQLQNLSKNNSLVIFPEGTRTKPGERSISYKSGIAMMYETLKWPILPVAVNTGMFWPKQGLMRSGTAKMKILPAMIMSSKKYDREQFLKQINEVIENESIELYNTTISELYGGK